MKLKTKFCEWTRSLGVEGTDDEIWSALRRDVQAEYEYKYPGRPSYPITEEELQYAARMTLEARGVAC